MQGKLAVGIKLIRHESRQCKSPSPDWGSSACFRKPRLPGARVEDKSPVLTVDTQRHSSQAPWDMKISRHPATIRSRRPGQSQDCGEMRVRKQRRQIEGMNRLCLGSGGLGVYTHSMVKSSMATNYIFKSILASAVLWKRVQKPLKCQEIGFLPRQQNAENCK